MMMKSSTIHNFENLHHCSNNNNKKGRCMNIRRLVTFFLWLLILVSIFTFFMIYSPNPFNVINPQKHPLKEDSLKELNYVDRQSPGHIMKPNKEDGDDEKKCDLFKGHWIPDLKGPLYTNSNCPMIPDSKNCGKYGRKDIDYMNWRWKPDECELPRFDPKTFLSIVRGKKIAFIGDSVARNQMESLLCLLSQEEIPKDIYKDSEDRFRTFYFPSHDFTLMVLWVKFLVVAEERVANAVFNIHLDRIDVTWAKKLPELDYAIISAGHWFFRKNYIYKGGKLIGCIYCDEPNITKLDIPFVLGRTFKSVLKYIDGCQDCKGSLVTLLRTFSPAHFEGGAWNGGGTCNRTSPYSEEQVKFEGTHWELRSNQVKQVQRIKKKQAERSGNKKRFEVLDVTRAMMMRPDGHPGPNWNNKYMQGSNDCLHWCLPGPIDVWNDLLMAVMRKKDVSSSY